MPFGGRHLYTGIVESVSDKAPAGIAVKPIAEALDTSPVIRHPQLKLWQWMADYYLCAIGDVYSAAMPSGLKIETESIVELAADEIDDTAISHLDPDQLTLIEQLRASGATTIKDLGKRTGLADIEAMLDRLIRLGYVRMAERSVERFTRRRTTFVSAAFDRGDPRAIEAAFDAVRRSEKQQHLLLTLMAMLGPANSAGEVQLTALLERAQLSRPVVKALADKGLLKLEARHLSRFDFEGTPDATLPELSQPQQTALKAIHTTLLDHDTALLHGVTSSGKTEIYIHLIDHVLRQGDQALMLVPEIALTTQLTHRLQRVFGKRVIIYHSKFSDAERMEIWRSLLQSHQPCIVVGARSAVFLPFARLGLVIVDEEHESSYKQTDPAPRYNGRDVAIVLAGMHGAKTLLGSATPAIETYYKAQTGKFGLVTLSERYGGVKLPAIEMIDLNRERERGSMTGVFADRTVAEARRTLADGHQLIIFHNRRGYSPMARCRLCQFIPKCDHCDVSLTYHRSPESLVCHYCGAVYPMPKVCPNCHEPALSIVGYGTERLEDNVERYFPDSPVLRMDLDTTRNKSGYSAIIDAFSAGKARILVGTQMVTKGLDFGRVAMVVIANADQMIHYPDFRASERAFNMLEQVSGRAGRRSDTPGRVLVQTREPDHPVLQFVAAHDYNGFYNYEIAQRQLYQYPPFTRVINIYLKHRDEATVDRHARDYAARLQAMLGNRVNGPTVPKVTRVKSLYIRQIMLKIETGASMRHIKQLLRQLYIDIRQSDLHKSLTLYYDVDPY